MTSERVTGALRRQWYVIVVGLALTAGAIFSLSVRPGVYFTQADVLFLAPKSAKYPNPIESGSESLIATAGLVARIANGVQSEPATASSGVTLMGEGVIQGTSIRLPNSGGQWANNFDRPVLDVQVVGPSEAWVRATLRQKIDLINETLHNLQAPDGTARENFITTSAAPQKSTVSYTRGETKRALAALTLLGITLTGLAALGFDRLVPWQRASSARKLPSRGTETA